MFLGLSTLVVAIVISIVAAYYSILGLTAIFAAAFWPIVIMGGALEIGKIMTAVWLHRNWKRASWAYKSYLIPALVVLMILTSMGIFGFLSKAHLDQSVPTGDVAAQVALIDEKINNERETIANARSLLTQLDKAVNDIGNGPDREIKLRDGTTKIQSPAERALQVRRQQARDRDNLTKTIEGAQARIVELQEQKSPIASELRKVEAKVGPIKYVASMIYGDDPDENLLEKAVRWVIVLIVIVFDPLAIVLILAGSKQIEWARGIDFETEDHHREIMRQKEIAQEESTPPVEPPREPDVDIDTANVLIQQLQPDIDIDAIVAQAQNVEKYEQQIKDYEQTVEHQQAEISKLNTNIEQFGDAIKTLDDERRDLEQALERSNNENSGITEYNSVLLADIERKNSEILALEKKQHDLREQMEEALGAAEQAINELDQLKKKKVTDTVGLENEFSLVADESALPQASGDVSFGSGFPSNPAKGDLYLRVDYLPSKLFKWNGAKWIEIDKRTTDSYAYNEQYIQHLVERIDAGEYDQDDLSDAERTQINEYLNRLG